MEPKFIIDREKVSDEEIEKNKNFDELVTKFKNQSIQKARNDRSWWKQKRIKYSAAILGVTVICTVTVSQLYNKTKSNKEIANDSNSTLTTNKKETTSPLAEKKLRTINPVNAKLDVPYTRYKVNAAKGGSLNHPSKSKIEVPKNAFVNKAGEVIEGEVEIMYREFHKISETIMSGIPMRYDSAGKVYDFESAGMFDIRGEQNGEPIFINPNANLKVQLASEKEGSQFNQYFLDTINNKWDYRCEDVTQKMPTSTKPSSVKKETSITKDKGQIVTQADIEKEIEKTQIEGLKKIETQTAQQVAKLPTPKAPVKPRKISNRQTFTLEVDKNEFPELSGFSNVVFEVGDENKNYSDKYTEVTWNDVLIKDGPKKGENYILNLRKGATVLELVVYPCLSGADFEKANAAFKSKMQGYEKELSDRKAKEEKLREEMVARQKEYEAEMKRNKAERLKEYIANVKRIEASVSDEINQLQGAAKVFRVFQVSEFGVYNSDCPRRRDPSNYMPTLLYAMNDKAFQPQRVLVIDYSTKMLNTYIGDEMGLVVLKPENRYALCVPYNGKLYVKQFSSNDAELADKPKKMTINLKELPSDMITIEDVKRYFEI